MPTRHNSEALQVSEQPIVWPITLGCCREIGGSSQRFFLHRHVSMEIDLSRFNGVVPQPKGDNCNIHAALEKVHSKRVAQSVRSHLFLLKRQAGSRCRPYVPSDQALKRVRTHRISLGGGKDRGGWPGWLFGDPFR